MTFRFVGDPDGDSIDPALLEQMRARMKQQVWTEHAAPPPHGHYNAAGAMGAAPYGQQESPRRMKQLNAVPPPDDVNMLRRLEVLEQDLMREIAETYDGSSDAELLGILKRRHYTGKQILTALYGSRNA